MQVNKAFRNRGVADEHGTWGNAEITSLFQEFPTIKPLVEALREENSWPMPVVPDKRGWSILFFVDRLVGSPTRLQVELKGPSGRTISSLQIDPITPPTFPELKMLLYKK